MRACAPWNARKRTRWPKLIAAVNDACAGGGYELALACDEIILADDRSSTVNRPEVPLLGVLPGTTGLTRLTDKRRVRRDLADVFRTTTEGVRGERALELAAASDRATDAQGVALAPIDCEFEPDALRYRQVTVAIDRAHPTATFTVRVPGGPQLQTIDAIVATGAARAKEGGRCCSSARSQAELPCFGPLMNLPRRFIDIKFAFSRTPGEPRRYGRVALRERAADVGALLADANTHVCVCGLRGMEEGVLDALRGAAASQCLDRPALHARLRHEGRLHIEIY